MGREFMRYKIKREFIKGVNFKWSEISCTTVVVDFRGCPEFKKRLFSFIRLLLQSYPVNIFILTRRDYELWATQGLISNTWRKFRFIADHSFSILYLFIALIMGYSEGAKWELSRDEG